MDCYNDATLFARAAEYEVAGITLPSPPVVSATSVLFADAQQLFGINDDLLARQGDRLDTTFQYGAISTPTVDAVAGAIARLEGAHAAIMTPSGQSAVLLAVAHFAHPGKALLVPDTLTYSTRALLEDLASRLQFRLCWLDVDTLKDVTVETLSRLEPFCIFLEVPGGFGFELPDVDRLLRLAHEIGVPSVVDNTWSSSVFFRPLEHGANVVMLSLSKLYGGPAGVSMGALAVNDSSDALNLRKLAALFGMNVSPESAARLALCLSTLHVRAHVQDATTRRVLERLTALGGPCRLLHLSLPHHPDYAVWKRSFSGACSVFTVAFDAVEPPALATAMCSSRLFRAAYGWGGNASSYYIFDPTGWRLPENRTFAGRSFVRFYIGLESAEDLAQDLEQALAILL